MGKDDFVLGVCRDGSIIVERDFFADLLGGRTENPIAEDDLKKLLKKALDKGRPIKLKNGGVLDSVQRRQLKSKL